MSSIRSSLLSDASSSSSHDSLSHSISSFPSSSASLNHSSSSPTPPQSVWCCRVSSLRFFLSLSFFFSLIYLIGASMIIHVSVLGLTYCDAHHASFPDTPQGRAECEKVCPDHEFLEGCYRPANGIHAIAVPALLLAILSLLLNYPLHSLLFRYRPSKVPVACYFTLRIVNVICALPLIICALVFLIWEPLKVGGALILTGTIPLVLIDSCFSLWIMRKAYKEFRPLDEREGGEQARNTMSVC